MRSINLGRCAPTRCGIERPFLCIIYYWVRTLDLGVRNPANETFVQTSRKKSGILDTLNIFLSGTCAVYITLTLIFYNTYKI